MNFDLTGEQTMLKETLTRLLTESYDFEKRGRALALPEGWSAEMWNRFVEMGLTSLPFENADGGLGGGPVETMIVMEALGSALTLEPFFSTVVLGGGFVRLGGNAHQRAAIVPLIVDGSLKLAFAHGERDARYDLHHVETVATRKDDGFAISGIKENVLHGDSADLLIVTARTSGAARDDDGIGVFVVDAHASGVTRRGFVMQDGIRAAEITFDSVEVTADAVLGDPGNGLPLVRQVVHLALAALCAEAVGVLSSMTQLAVDYLKMRKQFGVPIATFQALQHKAVDMFIAVEQARSITLYATTLAENGDPRLRAAAVHAAKTEIGRAARLVGEAAIQLHGGLGMTMDCAVGRYFKRAAMIDLTFGDADYHLEALAALGGLEDA